MLDRNFSISTQKLNLSDGSSVDQYKYQMDFSNGGSASISFFKNTSILLNFGILCEFFYDCHQVYLAIFEEASSVYFANKTLNVSNPFLFL